MMKTSNKTFRFVTSDDRKRAEFKLILENVNRIMNKLEVVKRDKEADILIIYSSTGAMLNSKLFKKVEKFQKSERKCYIYGKSENNIREILRLEKSMEGMSEHKIYGITINTGMKISQYNPSSFNLINQ